ncbi:MAG: GDP-L-fucose synthase [Planctomycetes bacterium]|nr:GDP-L-fucose synthase [Planctomycetota bacterium]
MSPPLSASSRVWVAGHSGLAGSAIVRRLAADGITQPLVASHKKLDLRDQSSTRAWIARHRPEFVFLAAATVGGILDNSSRPADFLYDNLMIAANVLEACATSGVGKVLVLGSSCIYPRDAAQPIREEALLTGALEPSNEAYAIAKIVALKLGEAYRRQRGMHVISAMPSNLYGPGDNFDLEKSHVLPALIRKFAEAGPGGTVTVWGSGKPRREFLHVDDLADALVFLAKRPEAGGMVNVGTGTDVTIAELAELVKTIVAPAAKIAWDSSKPDGTPRKLLDVSRMTAMGWKARIGLEEGIRSTWEWYRANPGTARK